MCPQNKFLLTQTNQCIRSTTYGTIRAKNLHFVLETLNPLNSNATGSWLLISLCLELGFKCFWSPFSLNNVEKGKKTEMIRMQHLVANLGGGAGVQGRRETRTAQVGAVVCFHLLSTKFRQDKSQPPRAQPGTLNSGPSIFHFCLPLRIIWFAWEIPKSLFWIFWCRGFEIMSRKAFLRCSPGEC